MLKSISHAGNLICGKSISYAVMGNLQRTTVSGITNSSAGVSKGANTAFTSPVSMSSMLPGCHLGFCRSSHKPTFDSAPKFEFPKIPHINQKSLMIWKVKATHTFNVGRDLDFTTSLLTIQLSSVCGLQSFHSCAYGVTHWVVPNCRGFFCSYKWQQELHLIFVNEHCSHSFNEVRPSRSPNAQSELSSHHAFYLPFYFKSAISATLFIFIWLQLYKLSKVCERQVKMRIYLELK